MSAVKFSKQAIKPNPLEVDYWIDITSNPYGGRIMYYNGVDWVDLLNAKGKPVNMDAYYNKLQINQMLAEKASVESTESKVDDSEIADVIKNIEFKDRGDGGIEMIILKYDDTNVGVTLPIASNTTSGVVTKESFKDFVKQNQLQQLYSVFYTTIADIRSKYQPRLSAGRNITIDRATNTIHAVGKISTEWGDLIGVPDFKPVATSGDYNDLINRPDETISKIRTDLNAEINRSTAAESVLQSNIDKEVSNRIADVDAELNRAVQAENTLQSNINNVNTAITNEKLRAEAEEYRLDNLIVSETELARANEATLQTNITKETERAVAKENELKSLIENHTTVVDAELELKADKSDTYTKAQVDAKVSGAYKVKGSRTFEQLPTSGNVVGDVYNISNIFTLDGTEYPVGTNVVYTETGWDALSGVFDTTGVEDSIQAIATDLAKEVTRATNAEVALSNRIDDETTDREESDQTLLSNIDSLGEDLADEVDRATTAESNLNTRIANEVSALNTKDTELNTAITTETNARIAADQTLLSNIDSVSSTVSTNKSDLQSLITAETTRATDAEEVLRNTISTETSNRKTSDATLLSNIDSVNTDLSEEINRATSRENSIETDYKAADSTLQSNIDIVDGKLVNYLPLTGGTMSTTNVVTNLNADMLDGYHYNRLFTTHRSDTYDLNTQFSVNPKGSWVIRIDIENPNAPSTTAYGNLVQFGNPTADTAFQLLSGYTTDVLYFRRGNFVETSDKCIFKHPWKTIAFTDSDITGNAATATKLSTPVKLWGNSFDGSSDVDGSMTVNGDVSINDELSVYDQITSGELVDWYGVSWSENNSSPTCTRIGNMAMHRSLPIQSAMKGYLITDQTDTNPDSVIPLLDDWSGTQYSIPTNESTLNDGTQTGSVMVKIPEFWYIDDYEQSTKTHNLKISQTAKAGWLHHKEAYVGAYEGYNDGTYYRSTKGVTPTVSVSRTTLRPLARANGYEDEYKWNIYTYEEHRAICHLFLVEYATRNSQLAVNATLTSDGFKQGGLGSGCTTGTVTIGGATKYSFIPTGTTDSLGNGSGQVAYTVTLTDTDGNETSTVTRYANRYRGIENPFGHIWKHVDDVITQYNADTTHRTAYKCNKPDQFATNKNTKYKPLCSFPGGLQGWKKEIKATINCDFFPMVLGGGEATYWSDYCWDSTDASEHCVLLGGRSDNGGLAGLFYFYLNGGVGTSSVTIGSRLTYLPWAE